MGLYRREARAMLEDLGRLLVRRRHGACFTSCRAATVDTLLPLSIEPAPSQLARVFVGRVELLAALDEARNRRGAGEWRCRDAGKVTAVFLNAFLREMRGEGAGLR